MLTVNANELINAGVAFQMQNEDAAFGDDGELVGYSEVVSREERDFEANEDDSGDHRNRYFLSSEGLSDTTELSTPYWVECARSHVADQTKAEHLATPRASDTQPLHGAMEFWQAQRAVRADRLLRMAKRLRKDKRNAKLAELKAGVRSRYAAAVKLIVARGATEWWMLYLTKEQAAAIATI